jgi:hypothetical protein
MLDGFWRRDSQGSQDGEEVNEEKFGGQSAGVWLP